jgi:hypothetical protein
MENIITKGNDDITIRYKRTLGKGEINKGKRDCLKSTKVRNHPCGGVKG